MPWSQNRDRYPTTFISAYFSSFVGDEFRLQFKLLILPKVYSNADEFLLQGIITYRAHHLSLSLVSSALKDRVGKLLGSRVKVSDGSISKLSLPRKRPCVTPIHPPINDNINSLIGMIECNSNSYIIMAFPSFLSLLYKHTHSNNLSNIPS